MPPPPLGLPVSPVSSNRRASAAASAQGHVPRGSVYKPLPGLPFSSGTPIEAGRPW